MLPIRRRFDFVERLRRSAVLLREEALGCFVVCAALPVPRGGGGGGGGGTYVDCLLWVMFRRVIGFIVKNPQLRP